MCAHGNKLYTIGPYFHKHYKSKKQTTEAAIFYLHWTMLGRRWLLDLGPMLWDCLYMHTSFVLQSVYYTHTINIHNLQMEHLRIENLFIAYTTFSKSDAAYHTLSTDFAHWIQCSSSFNHSLTQFKVFILTVS